MTWRYAPAYGCVKTERLLSARRAVGQTGMKVDDRSDRIHERCLVLANPLVPRLQPLDDVAVFERVAILEEGPGVVVEERGHSPRIQTHEMALEIRKAKRRESHGVHERLSGGLGVHTEEAHVHCR